MPPSTLERLRHAGLRVTKPRLSVLAAVVSRPHADTVAIIDAVRADLGTVSHQAVYDVLTALTQARLLRRIELPGSPARYESRIGDNHHHLVCRACDAIVDVDCATGEAPCLTPCDEAGFVVDEAEVVYRGLCPACADAPATPTPTTPHTPSEGPR